MNQFIFFDFEMLCSNRGMPYKDMHAIRLGAVKYDLETEAITYFDRYIKPKDFKSLSRFCENLTGIHNSDIRSANNFKTVFSEFLSWVHGIKRSRFFSWSSNDFTRLQLDAEFANIPLSTIKKIKNRYVDFQAVFSKRVSKNPMSVENALSLYDLTFVGEQHNPMYDAYNTFRIYHSFSNNPIKSDLIMLEHYLLTLENDQQNKSINSRVINNLQLDIHNYLNELQDIYRINHVKKVLRKTYKLVEKYKAILVNRSGLFSQQCIEHVQSLQEFHNNLLQTYEEHLSYDSKIVMFDEYLTDPLHQLSSTN
ncbi:3'-5' exonuclease [Bacillus solimangrovi]|uniref:3'-5' exonuclease n=1 Tax=Bacillus solimangrovi TaxID=1305675 RepID=UPI001FE11A35|nr:3'-5' exonuclease [Bacillus solimangrovi]